jgi:membrane associated rhomboid family serine protease
MYILADGTPLTEAQAEAYAKTHGALPQSRLHYAFLNDEHVWAPALGASGIACGLFTISATLWPKRNFWVLFFKVPASRLFLLFTAFSVGNLLINPNSHIAHAAHLGGAAIGLAAAVLLRGRALRIR